MARVVVVLLLAAVVVAGVAFLASPTPDSTSRDSDSPRSAEIRPVRVEPLAMSALAAGAPDCKSDDADGGRVFDTLGDRDRFFDDVAERLRPSADAEHLLVVALLQEGSDAYGALQLLQRASQIDPGNALVAARLLGLCSNLGEHCGEDIGRVERRLIHADGGNGMAWVSVAYFRAERDDVDGALDATRQAAAAADIDEHWAETILAFDRSLAAAADLPSGQRLTTAIGMAAAVAQPEIRIVEHCNLNGGRSGEWLDVCTRLGERFALEGRTIIVQSIGLSLQKNMYELAGDHQQRDRVRARQARFRERFDQLVLQTASLNPAIDEPLARDYLEKLAASNEMAAMAYLANELQLRVAAGRIDPPNPCAGP